MFVHPELKKTFQNDPHLLRPVRVKVLRSFCVGGRPLAVGDEATVEFHLGRDLVAVQKAEFVSS